MHVKQSLPQNEYSFLILLRIKQKTELISSENYIYVEMSLKIL